MATNSSEANINTLIVELMVRMSRLEGENRELKGKMEQNSEGNGPNWTGAIDNLEKKLMTSIEKISSDMKADAVYQKYEIDASAIENEEMKEEMKRIQRKTEDGLSCIRNDFSGRLKEVSDKQQGVSDAITALQGDIAEISHKIGRIEGKQNAIIQRLVPLEEKRQLISRQVDKGTILVLGGGKDGNRSDEMVILKQDKWIKLALKLPRKLVRGSAVYLGGEIYIFGGEFMEKELYKLDNKTLEWIRLADMNEERCSISNSSVEWNGYIWVFGGWNLGNNLKSVERYDPKKNKWIKMPDMKYYRGWGAAAVQNGKFIVCGGYDRPNHLKSVHLESVECFDPESGVWTELNDMPTPLSHHSFVSYGNNLILMGGSDGKTAVNTVLEVSNLGGKGTWKELPPMKQPRRDFSAAVLDNKIFVIGGSNGTGKYLDKTEIFNGNSWRQGPQLPNVCRFMSSIVIPRHLADILSNYIKLNIK